MSIDKEIVFVSVCVWRERQVGRGSVQRDNSRVTSLLRSLLHLCYVFYGILSAFSFSGILSVHVFWHFVRIPAFTVEFLLQTHPI